MPKIIKICLLVLMISFLISAQSAMVKEVTLYLPCAESCTLITRKCHIVYSEEDDLADAIFKELKKQSKSPGYIELYSADSYAELSGNSATVSISALPGFDGDYSAEYLTIYSAVNSLTSSGDIVTVRFTQGGEEKEQLYADTNMSEAFIPDYDICS